MSYDDVIRRIKDVAKSILPAGSELYLYGSRARGDAREDSDWDLLILLDKGRVEPGDFDRYSIPFIELGRDIEADIRPHAYTKRQWYDGPHAMFYYNVEDDKIKLHES